MDKQKTFGIILQYVQMALNILISLIYTPIMLRILGQNEYGIYNLASSIISYLSLLTLGFGASYLRFYSKYKKNDDLESIKRMNGLYLSVFSIMGLIALVAGLILSQNAQIFYNDTYTLDEINIAKVLMTFLAINLAISFPASVFTSYVTSQEKFIFQKLINLGKTVISPLVNIIFLYLGYGSIGMVISMTFISVLIDVINVFFCLKKLKMQISIKKLDFRLLKEIFIFSLFIALNQLIDQINWQTDKIILGKVVNGGAVAVYAIGAQINTMFTSFSTAISGVFAPKVNMIVQKQNNNMNEELTDLFIKVGRIQWFIMVLILSGFIFFGKYFILRWAGEDYENAYWVALLLMVPAVVPLIQNIGIEIQRAKNKHRVRSIAYFLMSIINIGISIWFSSMWGEIGAALGTTISIIICPIIFLNIYYYRGLGINIILFWKSILATFPGLLIPTIFGLSLVIFYEFKSLLIFILLVIAYIIIYLVSNFIFGLNKHEKKFVHSFISKMLKRNN